MKKQQIITKLFLAILTVTIFFSCEGDFLEQEITLGVTTQQLKDYSKANPNLVAGLVPGIYSLTFQFEVGGWGGHTDFGHKSLDIASDLMSGDMVLTSKRYGKFAKEYELTDMTKTGGRPYMTWRYYYKVIRATNGIIDSFGDKMPTTEKGKNTYGQAKALRAYAYLYLVNYFQHPYLESKDKLSVVLYNKLDDKTKGLASVNDVYKLIVNDLKTSIIALDKFNRKNKSEINKYVATGLLTYAYLFMGEYSKAEQTASNIINNGGFTLMSKEEITKSGFSSINIPGWMWAIDLTTDNSPKLPTFWGMVDVFTYSYASVGNAFAIDQGLYNAIPATDERKKQFAPFFKSMPNQFLPLKKFYDANRKYQGDRTWANDEVYMRVAEFYLAKAEAQARQGNDAGAKATLLQLVSQRDTKASEKINPLSGQELLDEIYFQWRIEMWGEGKSLFAAKRFKKTITRGANHIDLAGKSYPYNDKRMIFEIPESELNNNPLIK